MARQYIPLSVPDLIDYTIGLYYQMLSENENIRMDHKKHLHETLIIERHYQKLLKKNNWETEETTPLFRKQIDFLTGVYTKEVQVQATNSLKDKFRKIAV